MSPENTILLALVLPLIGAVGIGLAGRWPNLREAVTLVTATALAILAVCIAVWDLAFGPINSDLPAVAYQRISGPRLRRSCSTAFRSSPEERDRLESVLIRSAVSSRTSPPSRGTWTP